MSKKKTAAPAVAAPTIAKSSPLLDSFEKQWYWHYALLVFLPFFVFIKTAGYEFIAFDDQGIILNNMHILGSIKHIGQSFTTDAFLSAHGDFYRPMQTVSFFVDAFIGNEKPWIYHLTNLVYHILTVVSVYLLLRRLGIRRLSALFAALIFSVHPMLASAISWVPSRGDILLGLFGTQMFICFIRYWEADEVPKKVLWLVLSFIGFALALFSKETAVLLPLLPILYLIFLTPKKVANHTKLVSYLTLGMFYLLCLLIGLLFYYLRGKVVTASPPDFILGIKPLINNLPSIPIFFAKAILPFQLSTMPLFSNGFVTIGVILLAAALWLTVRSIKWKDWLVLFGLGWFMLFLVPPLVFKLYYSNYLIEYYEHRSYMPMIGLFVVVGLVLDRVRKYAKLYLWGTILVTLTFTVLATFHSDNFKNSMAFFGRAADLGNAGALTKRGEIHYDQRDISSAMTDFEKAIEVSDGNYPPAYFNRANILTRQVKDYKKAEEDYSKALLLDTSFIDAYINRAEERILTSNFLGAMEDLNKAEQFDASNPKIYYTKAKVFTSANKFTEAEAMFSKAISMDSFSAESYNDRAYVRFRLKKYDGALADCDRAIQLFHDLQQGEFLNAYYNKAMILYETGKTKEAIAVFDITLSLANNFYFGYFYRGMAKKSINDMKGACADWQQSVNLGFAQAQDTIRAYCK
jgi:tetratricopeptide (TPR) repeat protein